MENRTEELAPIARRQGLIVRELAEEVLVYDEQTNAAHSLSPTAAFVWRHCDGRTSVAEIAALLQEQSSSVTVQPDSVWAAIEELGESDLLEVKAHRIELGKGVTRREALKWGAAATAAPLIWTLITPVQAMASTCPSTCCPASQGNCIVHSATGCTGSGLTCCGCTDADCPCSPPGVGTCNANGCTGIGRACVGCCKTAQAGGAGVCGCIGPTGSCD